MNWICDQPPAKCPCVCCQLKRARESHARRDAWALLWKWLSRRLREQRNGIAGLYAVALAKVEALKAAREKEHESHARELMESAQRYGAQIERLQRERDLARDERDAYGKELASDRTNVDLVEERDRLQRERDEAVSGLDHAGEVLRAVNESHANVVRNRAETQDALAHEREAHAATQRERDDYRDLLQEEMRLHSVTVAERNEAVEKQGDLAMLVRVAINREADALRVRTEERESMSRRARVLEAALLGLVEHAERHLNEDDSAIIAARAALDAKGPSHG